MSILGKEVNFLFIVLVFGNGLLYFEFSWLWFYVSKVGYVWYLFICIFVLGFLEVGVLFVYYIDYVLCGDCGDLLLGIIVKGFFCWVFVLDGIWYGFCYKCFVCLYICIRNLLMVWCFEWYWRFLKLGWVGYKFFKFEFDWK